PRPRRGRRRCQQGDRRAGRGAPDPVGVSPRSDSGKPLAAEPQPALLLYPGAGSSSDHPALVAIEAAVAPRRCTRADFGYRIAGRKAPDRAPKLIEEVRAEVLAHGTAVVIGGRSMGGRICSMLAAADDAPESIAGLALISYPLHPPGRPDKLRV